MTIRTSLIVDIPENPKDFQQLKNVFDTKFDRLGVLLTLMKKTHMPIC